MTFRDFFGLQVLRYLRERGGKMTYKRWASVAAVVLILVLNFALLGRRFWRPRPSQANLQENQQISDDFRFLVTWRRGEEIGMIGNLAKNEFGNVLQLTEKQKFALRELNDLASEARVQSLSAEAEPYDGDPARRRRDIARRDGRRAQSITHAQRLVTAGLLTEEQAAYMVQNTLNGDFEWNYVYEGSIQELIAVTPSQQRGLAQVGKDIANEETAKALPVAFSRDPQDGELFKNIGKESLRRQELEVRKILTPVQLEKWGGLTATRRPPAAPPRSTRESPSDAEEAAVVIEDMSPTFRALAERGNALGLNSDQTKLLERLKVVTRLGLIWIRRERLEAKSKGVQDSPKSDSPFAHVPEDFVKHAEQVALCGILTEQQAEKVGDLIK
jgi:hypothetical protein